MLIIASAVSKPIYQTVTVTTTTARRKRKHLAIASWPNQQLQPLEGNKSKGERERESISATTY